MTFYCCNNCIDIALDEVVDETGMAPEMEFIKDDEDNASKKCFFCEQEARYIVHK